VDFLKGRAFAAVAIVQQVFAITLRRLGSIINVVMNFGFDGKLDGFKPVFERKPRRVKENMINDFPFVYDRNHLRLKVTIVGYKLMQDSMWKWIGNPKSSTAKPFCTFNGFFDGIEGICLIADDELTTNRHSSGLQ
jgi:hypothetical protein